MLTYYQETELIVGVFLFMLFYMLYLAVRGQFSLINILLTTVMFALFFTCSVYIKTLYRNYNIED